MSKTQKIIAIVFWIIATSIPCIPVHAIELDSVITSDGKTNSYSYGINYYQDSQVLTGYDTSGCGTDCVLLISSTTPYTILKVDFQGSFQGGASPSIWCGSTPMITYWIQEIGAVGSDQQSFSYQTPLHCSENLYLDNADNMSWFVQFVPYDTRQSIGYEANLTDIYFEISIILTFMFVAFLGLIWASAFKRKKKWQ